MNPLQQLSRRRPKDYVNAMDAPAPSPVRDARSLTDEINAACERACSAIAPVWPLDQSIAVNPYWQRIDTPLRTVAARMAVLGGIQLLPPRSYVREAWRTSRIAEADLTTALDELGYAPEFATPAVEALHRPLDVTPIPLLIDLIDPHDPTRPQLPWRDAVAHQISQTCAAYFDQFQADWQPDRSRGLYEFWRDAVTHDHGIGVLMEVPELAEALRALPRSREDTERWALERLRLPVDMWGDYLEAVLLTVNGWASWCAYLGWQARHDARRDWHLRELLAIRLAWGAALLECAGSARAATAFRLLHSVWHGLPERIRLAEAALWADDVWQRALEIGYQRQLALRLSAAPGAYAETVDAPEAEVQAVFCIDVRSERLRRAVENVWPEVHTMGFAGFFGLPIAYSPLGTNMRRAQLPGLLPPALQVADRIRMHSPGTVRDDAFTPQDALTTGAAAGSAHEHDEVAMLKRAEHRRRRRLATGAQWRSATRWPGAAFSTVEAVGVTYVIKLAQWVRARLSPRHRDDLAGLPTRLQGLCRPELDGVDLETKVTLSVNILRAMGLDRGIAPLVLLIGHGSQSANNAHAAALDCGACCGQTGEVNARVLAQLLNDPAVRRGVQDRGLSIPGDTRFVAALHNTTTDDMEWFDTDGMAADMRQLFERTQRVFMHAGDAVRRERASDLGLDPRSDFARLRTQMQRRANDGAETRPEWGLAGNATFIIAPRSRTRHVHLDGRAFLHDYHAASDPEGTLLELLMTAPMLVTHWINWQYHASLCDPEHCGSGNKVLHNVVGGHLGVFEGNGGDLRIGLAKQSLHDGTRWMHEPLRLTVVIDAPREAIDRVVHTHATVRHLVHNGWLHLWRFEGTSLERCAAGWWRPADYAA